MKARLEKVILFCADVQQLVHFYQDIFGLTPCGEADDTWTVLNAGPTLIAFHRIGDQYLTTTTEKFTADSNVKFVFEIDTDLDAFRQHLIDKGVDIGEIKQFPGYTYQVCDGRDPEGNVFQLLKT